ncbi:restriction endonuclease subunit S [Limosilactobacillus reuteri]|uniref:restriction endonuclease subunit S n=1 Tax=Limosilactobacillus reuteri TaxID=1598 RepID=UPI002F263627
MRFDSLGNICTTVTDYVANGSFKALKENVSHKNAQDGYAILIRLADYRNKFKGPFEYIDRHGYNFLSKTKLYGNEIIISNVGAHLGTVFRTPTLGTPMSLGPNAILLKTKYIDDYYYYFFTSKKGQALLKTIVSGSAQPKFNKTDLKKLIVPVPSLDEQNKISRKLLAIDKKIQINEQINANLDELMSEIFERYVTEANVFTTDSLSNIANYKNGLAMQRFRPNGADKGLPVLKIKELNQGFTDSSSDRCLSKISNDVIVKTGDIIFSWSGTLIVKIWTGTTCGLNQHLFKVTSDKYPKWFIYKWTEYYLRQFQSIAAGKATTMGHIKRSDLKQAEVKIPHKSEIDRLDKLISPIFKRYVNNILEINSLKELKNELLSKIF